MQPSSSSSEGRRRPLQKLSTARPSRGRAERGTEGACGSSDPGTHSAGEDDGADTPSPHPAEQLLESWAGQLRGSESGSRWRSGSSSEMSDNTSSSEMVSRVGGREERVEEDGENGNMKRDCVGATTECNRRGMCMAKREGGVHGKRERERETQH